MRSVGCSARRLDRRVDDAVDPVHEPAHLRRLALQRGEVLAVEADGQRLAGAGQHAEAVAGRGVLAARQRADVAQLLGGVRRRLRLRALDAVDGVVDRRARLVVVGAGLHAHDDLGRVDVDDPVAADRAADLAADVLARRRCRRRSRLRLGGDRGHRAGWTCRTARRAGRARCGP